jgi:hypothetical protein
MLQIENDELVLRLAEVLIENKRLEKFVNEALNAKEAGQKVVSGCDPRELEKLVVISWASESWPAINRKSEAWIRTFGPNCTINQLNTIYNEIGNYTDYPSTAKAMLKYMIKSSS